MDKKCSKTVAVIVAHPDDETLWAGGTIIGNTLWECFIACLCRASDKERAEKFKKALRVLGAEGKMNDLDDGPEQKPLPENEIENAILQLLPSVNFNLIITHNPTGEYTKHLRHEEVSKAVINLWYSGKISANELWTFAYEDGGKKYYPKPIETAPGYYILTQEIWLKKYNLITETYGFEKNSWEEKTVPKGEAFWQFTNPDDALKWLDNKGILL